MLELDYVDESRLLHALLPLLSSSRLLFAIVTRVAVASRRDV